MEKITVGEMLKYLRNKENYTQKELGELCNMKDSQIRRYENGHVIPKAITLFTVLESLLIFYLIISKDGVDYMPTQWLTLRDTSITYVFDLRNNLAWEIDNTKDPSIINYFKENSEIFKYKTYPNTLLYDLDQMILDKMQNLNDTGKQKVIDFVDSLSQIPEYKK